ncbi:uncharacterized protein LOC134826362 [Bolinopsis microptera]|uniref:uncharacterized protein LOC134826362 n=1 Tax=Bolinopsis microptera TaxID=2820187 RepID=UPI00307A33B2
MMEIQGSNQTVNIQLSELAKETKELMISCNDREPIHLSHSLLETDILLERLSLRHVNLIPEVKDEERKPPARLRRRISSFGSKSHEIAEEVKQLKDKQELELYKTVFAKWSGLTHLEIVDGAGVLTEPLHFIKSLPVVVPQLESLKIKKTMDSRSTGDDYMILDSGTMSSLAQLDNLRVLHLLGFAGRQDRYQRYLFTNLDDAVETLAHKGRLEEFHFSQSGISYRSIFALIRHCKNLREMTVWSRFGEPGLFMLHHNLPFLNLADHHQNSAVYEPEEDSPRQLTMSLTNVVMEQSRYDPAWINDTYPEEKITVKDLLQAEEKNGVDRSDGE